MPASLLTHILDAARAALGGFPIALAFAITALAAFRAFLVEATDIYRIIWPTIPRLRDAAWANS
eukprot:3724645-Amphidinium_carterae.1